MNRNYFKIVRAGINTTFQDQGRKNLYHIGIPFSGAMDSRNYLLANKLAGNKLESPVIEFAYQGHLLKYFGGADNLIFLYNISCKPYPVISINILFLISYAKSLTLAPTFITLVKVLMRRNYSSIQGELETFHP